MVASFPEFSGYVVFDVLVTPKQELERKREWFCSNQISKKSEKTVFEQKFAVSMAI